MRSTADTRTYAFRTQRIWSRVVLSAVLIAGIATLTIVVSSMIMKNPEVRTSSTNHGLVRACAMSPPYATQRGEVRIAPDLPLQPSFLDLFLEVDHPFAFGLEHRDLVIEVDAREPGESQVAALGDVAVW